MTSREPEPRSSEGRAPLDHLGLQVAASPGIDLQGPGARRPDTIAAAHLVDEPLQRLALALHLDEHTARAVADESAQTEARRGRRDGSRFPAPPLRRQSSV